MSSTPTTSPPRSIDSRALGDGREAELLLEYEPAFSLMVVLTSIVGN